MKRFVFITFIALASFCQISLAGDFAKRPDMSLYVGFDLGAGLDVGPEARFPTDYYASLDPEANSNPEAYSLGSFLFGIFAGFRFNENIGIEMGWHEQQHETDRIWGGVATYELAHLALRLAIPLQTRQTLSFRIGPTIGGFAYGDSSLGMFEDNLKLAVGGIVSFTLEHEIAMGIVGTLNLSYLPMARIGGDKTIGLCMHVSPELAQSYDFDACPEPEPYEYAPPDSEPYSWVLYSEKDFSANQFVQIIWLSLGLQFEWIFR